jgi:hypothetical protein
MINMEGLEKMVALHISYQSANKALVRMQTTLRFVCTAQLERWASFTNRSG